MKEASLAIVNTTRASAKMFRKANWLLDAEPYSRSTNSSSGSDDLRLRAALKRAVERDLAPRTLIDVIKNKIRNIDESR